MYPLTKLLCDIFSWEKFRTKKILAELVWGLNPKRTLPHQFKIAQEERTDRRLVEYENDFADLR